MEKISRLRTLVIILMVISAALVFVILRIDTGMYIESIDDALHMYGVRAGGAPDDAEPAAVSQTPFLILTATPTAAPASSPTPIPKPKPAFSPTPIPIPTPRPLIKGTVGDDVRHMQDLLFIRGFLGGIADGIYGSETEGAIIEFKEYLNQVYAMQNRDDPVLRRYSLDGTSLSPEFLSILEDEANFPILDDAIQSGSKGIKVTRIQRRLNELGYMLYGIDGAFGDITGEALTYFQKLSGLEQTGVADAATQRAIFSKNAKKSDRQLRLYKLVVDVSDQRVYAYKWNESIKDYDALVRTMVCSTGKKATPTPLGSYQDSTGPGARWHYFKKFNCWAQYAFYIEGDILFHSVLYGSKGGKVQQSSVNNLGKRASHGCVRLSVEDAKWVYENCTFGTPIVVRN